MDMNQTKNPPTRTRRDMIVAASCGVFVAAMVGMAYASVPFYDWFCRATGFGGTTQVASVAPAGMLDRKVTVRFDANIGPGLPWRFEPEVNSVDVRIGEVATVYFTIVSDSARATLGQAAYNVTPPTVRPLTSVPSARPVNVISGEPGGKAPTPIGIRSARPIVGAAARMAAFPGLSIGPGGRPGFT